MLPMMTNHDRGLGDSAEPQPGEPQLAVLQRLSQEIQQLETSGRGTAEQTVRSAGCAALDALLPSGGYAAGSVVEYLRCTPACGASTLAWAAAAAALRASSGGFLVVVDPGPCIYPPVLTSHGIDLNQVIFVRPESQADALWAVDQALRTSAVVAVVAELERIDARSARRLQLAAEGGAGLALLLRSASARQQPSWAEVQWLVGSDRPAVASRQLNSRQLSLSQLSPSQLSSRGTSPVDLAARLPGPLARSLSSRRLQVQLLRVRGGQTGATVALEVDALTGKLTLASAAGDSRRRNGNEPTTNPAQPASQSALYLASQLAHTTRHRRRSAAG